MYKTTLVNLAADASRATLELGRKSVGELTKPAALLLLNRFLALDPLQNFEADPEIIFESRRRKRLVRLSAGKLCLYDPSNSLAVALVLSPDEILAELDNAGPPPNSLPTLTARQAAPLRLTAPPVLLALLRPVQRASLATLAIGLASYLLVAWFPGASPVTAARFTPLVEDQAYADQLARLAGVYLTGNRPGDHGIVVGADGALKIFELNGASAPSLIRDTIRLGHIDGHLAGLTNQPGGALGLTGINSLIYCGESYRRVP
jgi:hypothetical protein